MTMFVYPAEVLSLVGTTDLKQMTVEEQMPIGTSFFLKNKGLQTEF